MKLKVFAKKVVVWGTVISMALPIGVNTNIIKTSAASEKTQETKELRLWYDKPVSEGRLILSAGSFNTSEEENRWQQLSLPIGNSYMGANIYGEVEEEHLTFNQKTLWDGGPSEKRPNYNGGNITKKDEAGKTMADYYKEIQKLFQEGKNDKASAMCNKLVGLSDGYGSYQAWGDIYFNFGIPRNQVSAYKRDLDLNTAIASVDFNYNQSNYKREYFISYPDNVLAMKFTADNGQKLNFDIRFPAKKNSSGAGAKNDETVIDEANKTITLKGAMEDNQLKFNSILKVENTGGSVAKSDNDKLQVSNANSAVVFVCAGTDYKNDYPKYRTEETDDQLEQRIKRQVNLAVQKGYDNIKSDHIKDYQNIFKRVDLDLGQTIPSVPTNDLLEQYKQGNSAFEEERYLEVLLFQYGRYLTIASSRQGDLPSNLQGVWNNRVGGANHVPWGSDYHMNVNLQMSYWPTYSSNMAECAIPLIEYINSLREPGRITAQTYTGVKSDKENPENGFTAHTQNTPFGWTCPGWNFSWGWSPAAVPWILQNCWEYYEYTGDVEYMRENIYPMLREEALFYDQTLIDDGNGNLVSAPAYSPEHGPRTMGNTYEQSLIWQLYEDTVKAAEILNVDADKVKKWKETQSKLNPIEIGESGQIKEWREETYLGSIGENNHRHMSHLLGLFPGDLISVDNSQYMDAAIISLKNRGMESTGWGMGQRINAWARTGDGNQAYQLIRTLFRGGIYPNLWDSHPPFQIDGNFGLTSGVTEMLMQSNMDYINVLPALPDKWSNGKVDGLIARGNFEVGISWNEGAPTEVRILSKNGGECIVQTEDIAMANVIDTLGNPIQTQVINKNKILFNTTKGQSFIINNFMPASLSAPTNVNAYKIGDNQVQLEWDLVEGANTYEVYRQIEKGEFQLLGDEIKETTYLDDDAYNILGKIAYKVKAIDQDKREGKFSEKTTQLKDIRRIGIIDDRELVINYSNEWKKYDYDTGNYNSTMHFIEKTKGGEWIETMFVGTGIKVIVPTNSNAGNLKVSIDGKVVDLIDCYTPKRQFKNIVFEKNDLPLGMHKIKLEATGTKNSASTSTKIEFDAFEVINSRITFANSIVVNSKSGANMIGMENGTMKMEAVISPDNATVKDVDWSVNDEDIAAISIDGILTVKDKSGVIVVTATAKDGSGVIGQKTIKVQFPEKLVEENIKNNNVAITYSPSPDGAAWATWSDAAHYSGQVYFIENANASGAAIEMNFTGVGIEVYSPFNTRYDSYDIYLDGEKKINVDLGQKSDAKQQMIYQSEVLENKEHTIKLVVVKRDNKTENTKNVKAEFDYFKVLKPSNSLNKVILQQKLQEIDILNEKSYTTDSWNLLVQALQSAITIMNNENAEENEITKAAESLSAAITTLVIVQELPAAVNNLKAIGIEDQQLTLVWDLSDLAVKYEIYGTDGLIGITTENYYKITGLKANTEYVFNVVAVSLADKKSEKVSISTKTRIKADREEPQSPSNLKASEITKTSAKLTWELVEEAIEYRIYVNGSLKTKVTENSYLLEGLSEATSYIIKLTAVDSNGRESLPATISIKQ